MELAGPRTQAVSGTGPAVPHVIAWNLTRRCNLACAHCYISAGEWHSGDDELSTEECLRVIDEILRVNPAPMLILSGGEPLLRSDLDTLAAQATQGGATVVVGTNGLGLSAARIEALMAAGVQGVAVSVESLRPEYHDRFRHGAGALRETLAAIGRLREARLDVVIQTSLTRANAPELEELVAWAESVGAVSFNLYFLVQTGRGAGMEGLTPVENEEVLRRLIALEREYRGRIMVRSKCQPAIMRHAFEADPESPLLGYSKRCPCGVQYCRITPDGKVTPCPYLPAVAGDLRKSSFGEIWRTSQLFGLLRGGELGGRCGRCEYREICGGCRARAYATDGDFLDEDPSCAYVPSGREPLVHPAPPGGLTYGTAPVRKLSWSADAEAKLARIPSFVRGVVAGRVENYAREHGHVRITAELMEEMRAGMPVDFSRRIPFFARRRQ